MTSSRKRAEQERRRLSETVCACVHTLCSCSCLGPGSGSGHDRDGDREREGSTPGCDRTNGQADVLSGNLLPLWQSCNVTPAVRYGEGTRERTEVSVELARVKLRGVYAVVAGITLLVGVQVYQAVVLT